MVTIVSVLPGSDRPRVSQAPVIMTKLDQGAEISKGYAREEMAAARADSFESSSSDRQNCARAAPFTE
jgi:hypothetical protein